MLAALAADPALRAGLVEAAALDTELAVWARYPAEAPAFDLAPLPQRSIAPSWRWWSGGLAAAAIAASVALLMPMTPATTSDPMARTAMIAAPADRSISRERGRDRHRRLCLCLHPDP